MFWLFYTQLSTAHSRFQILHRHNCSCIALQTSLLSLDQRRAQTQRNLFFIGNEMLTMLSFSLAVQNRKWACDIMIFSAANLSKMAASLLITRNSNISTTKQYTKILCLAKITAVCSSFIWFRVCNLFFSRQGIGQKNSLVALNTVDQFRVTWQVEKLSTYQTIWLYTNVHQVVIQIVFFMAETNLMDHLKQKH